MCWKCSSQEAYPHLEIYPQLKFDLFFTPTSFSKEIVVSEKYLLTFKEGPKHMRFPLLFL